MGETSPVITDLMVASGKIYKYASKPPTCDLVHIKC